MESRSHQRTASKNFQSFRFFFKFISENSNFEEITLKIYFKISEEWLLHSNLPNILNITTFCLSYVFEELLQLKFELLCKNVLFFTHELNFVHLISKPETFLDSDKGILYIKTEDVKEKNSAVNLKIGGKFNSGFWFWRPHYYIRMWRELNKTDYLVIYESESVPGKKCKWKNFTVPFNMLGEKKLKFSVHNGSNDVIGEKLVTIDELLTPGTKFVIKEREKVKGKLKITWSQLELQQNFVDYLRAGINIKVIVAVDYTSSNLAYTNPLSHHYLSENTLNPYQASMKSISKVLEPYNKSDTIELYGFGGIPKDKHEISHCFKLGVASSTSELLEIYQHTLKEITLSRPTNLNEIIQQSMNKCKEDTDPMSYYVVLIITDGDIHDFPQTSTRIVYSCRYPLSFIIIGVGNADFRNMEKLDSDGTPLTDREGRIAERDIVQFVPFNQYRNHPGLLASKVLEELPEQICGYMQFRNRSNF